MFTNIITKQKNGYEILTFNGTGKNTLIICENESIKVFSKITGLGLEFNNIFDAVKFSCKALTLGHGFTTGL